MYLGKACGISGFLFAVLLLLPGCGKKEDRALPVTEIISPARNAVLFVPGSYTVRIHISSSSLLKNVKVNITNGDFIPVFGDVIFQPLKNEVDTAFAFALGVKGIDPDDTYMFHVLTENSAGVKNNYVPVVLKNRVPFLNDILFARENDNTTEIVNEQNQTVATVEGRFKEMAFDPELQTLFVETNRPSLLQALYYPDLFQLWSYRPQTTVAFQGLWSDERQRRIYCLRSDGSVYGFDFRNGNLRFTTRFMPDTVPSAVVTTNDYLFGTFTTLQNGYKLWITFYKTGGEVLYRQQADASSLFVLPYGENSVALGQNSNSGGAVLFYDTDKNEITAVQTIAGEEMVAACSGPQDGLFVATRSKLFYLTAVSVEEITGCGITDPLEIKYYDYDRRLYVLEKGRLKVLKWPECTLVTHKIVDESFTAFQPVYAYEQ